MTRRITTFALYGIGFALCAYLGYRIVCDRVVILGRVSSAQDLSNYTLFKDRVGMVPIFLFEGGADPGRAVVRVMVWGRWPTQAIQIEVVKGEAFIGGKLMPKDQIVPYINATTNNDIPFVIVSVTNGESWNGVVQVLDACRHSAARIAFVSEHTSI